MILGPEHGNIELIQFLKNLQNHSKCNECDLNSVKQVEIT